MSECYSINEVIVITNVCISQFFLREIIAVDICLLHSVLLNRMVPEFVAYFQTLYICLE